MIKRTIKPVAAALSPAPSAMFPNSSSAIGTRPGQSYRHPGFGGKPKIARGFADEIRRLLPRHQRRVIEHRLDLDETAQFARIGRLLGQTKPRQEKNTGRPASTSSKASPSRAIGRSKSSSVPAFVWTP